MAKKRGLGPGPTGPQPRPKAPRRESQQGLVETISTRRHAFELPGEYRAKTRSGRRVDPNLTRERIIRQRRLSAAQRTATERALDVGKPIGRKRRQKLNEMVPEALREAICGERKARREALFAKKRAGKGKKAPGRGSRQLSIWSAVRC